MKLNQKLIEQLRNGKVAVENDGTQDQLKKVLAETFPKDTPTDGGFTYYEAYLKCPGKWMPSDFEYILAPTIVSVKDFFMEEQEFEWGEVVEVSKGGYVDNWYKRYFIGMNPQPHDNKYVCAAEDGSVAKYPKIRKIYKQTEVTLDQIAEKFNIPVNQLKIKK